MLLPLTYLGVATMFALLPLLPRCDHDKDTEILVLRHQIASTSAANHPVPAHRRALLAALLHPLPRPAVLR